MRAVASTRRAKGKPKKRGRTVALVLTKPPAAPPPGPQPPEPPVNAAADRARAARIALKLADLPAGWERSTDTVGMASACSEPDLRNVSGRHEFTLFRSGLATSAGSDVSVFTTVAAAIGALGAVPDEVNACLESLVGSTIDGATIEALRVAGLTSPDVGDRSSAFRIEIDATASFLDFTLVVDVVYVQRERALVVLAFTELLSPIVAGLKSSAVAARMAP